MAEEVKITLTGVDNLSGVFNKAGVSTVALGNVLANLATGALNMAANAFSDLVGGVSLDDKDELLASVLLDLSQTATMSASTEVARTVLQELRAVVKTHKRQVERAGFMVLKSPDIPSILVEADFITNPHVARKLTDAHHQTKLAEAVVRGVKKYFQRNAPSDSYFAKRQYTIARGDTLSGIASRYGPRAGWRFVCGGDRA